MSVKRFFYIMIAANAALLVLIFVSVFIGNNLFSQQAEKLKEAKINSKMISQQQESLTQAKKDIETYKELNDIAKSIVPQDKDQAKTVREITKIATESNIKLKGISFPTSSLGQQAPATTTPSNSGTTPQPSAQATPKLTQLKPVEGITGVYALEIIVTSLDSEPVPYENLIIFLEKLESKRRTAHVRNLSITPDETGSLLSFTLTLNAYVKP